MPILFHRRLAPPRLLALPLYLLALVASLAFAADFPVPPMGVTFTVPDHWTTSQNDGPLKAYSPDKLIGLVVTLADGDEAYRDWQNRLIADISNLEPGGDVSDYPLNDGLIAKVRRGSGTIDGMGAVALLTMVIENSDQRLLITIVQSSAAPSTFEGDVTGIIQSIRRTN